jgi:raffinose/stachyose/melibiose transport system substrate-binding protein
MTTPKRLAALFCALVLLSAACLPGGGEDTAEGDAGSEAATTGGAEETASAHTDHTGQELVVWDIYVRGVEREVADQLTAEFEEEHGVTVTREPRNLDDLKATLPLAMGQDDGPDVASVNQGRADMGAMIEAGLLMDLTDFGQQQGWFDTWGENLLARSSFSEDGSEFGSGNLYGVAPQAELVGWFYNREKFEQYDLEPPETFDDLEALLARLKEEGETPITFGNLDAWPAIHTYGAIEHTFVDTAYLDDFIFGRGDATFDRPENADAAGIVQTWADQGYFSENFSGIGYDDSWAQFGAGEGALMLTGTWIAGELDAEQFGFFLTPGRDGQLPPQTGGMGVPLAVRADTEVPELATAYVDWMTGDRAAELWAEAWLPTRTPPAEAVESSPLMGEMVAAWEEVIGAEQLGHYLDWATPTFYDTISAQLQTLLAGDTSPDGFVDALEEDYAGQ